MIDNRPLLYRIVNPGVPWWVAIPCNVAAGIALVLLAIDPDKYLPVAIAILLPATIMLYGTAALRSLPTALRALRRSAPHDSLNSDPDCRR
jgi:hypothetical protein